MWDSGSSVGMVRDKAKAITKNVGVVIGGSFARMKRTIETIVAKFHASRNKIPVYVIQHDGTIKRTWENPANHDNRAFDIEHNHKNQVFMEGYANALDVSVENIEKGDVKLKPSGMYKTYMQQQVIKDSYLAGNNTLEQVKYMSMGTIVMLIIGIIVVVSMMG